MGSRDRRLTQQLRLVCLGLCGFALYQGLVVHRLDLWLALTLSILIFLLAQGLLLGPLRKPIKKLIRQYGMVFWGGLLAMLLAIMARLFRS